MALKLVGPVARASQPWYVKVGGCIHLTSYLVHPLMLMVVLLTLPMSFSGSRVLAAAPWLMVAAVGPPLMYFVAEVTDGALWRTRLRALPLLVMLGMGLALNNPRAVLKAVLGLHQGFERTPKHALRRTEGAWVSSEYAIGADWLAWGELALALLAAPRVTWGFAPWLMLYSGGFAYVARLSLAQAWQLRR